MSTRMSHLSLRQTMGISVHLLSRVPGRFLAPASEHHDGTGGLSPVLPPQRPHVLLSKSPVFASRNVLPMIHRGGGVMSARTGVSRTIEDACDGVVVDAGRGGSRLWIFAQAISKYC